MYKTLVKVSFIVLLGLSGALLAQTTDAAADLAEENVEAALPQSSTASETRGTATETDAAAAALISNETAVLSTSSVDAAGVTNLEFLEPLLNTPLKRYNARTAEHIFWRTDALVFISIPFSFLWSTILKEALRNFSVVAAFLEGARSPVLNSVNFAYSQGNYPAATADPLDIFTWANLGLWPVVVAVNDIIDRSSDPKRYEKVKARMRANRFYRELLFQNFY